MALHSIITDGSPWNLYSTEMNDNATEIYSVLYHTYNWTLEAVCGALGNMTHESSLNPGQYEYGHGTPTNPNGYGYGVGLIQFTSPDPSRYPNPWLYWCQLNNVAIDNGYEQLKLIANADDPYYQDMGIGVGGIWGWLKIFNVSLPQYASSTDAPSTLAEIFYQNMENHGGTADSSLPIRKDYANHWYQYFTGVIPPDPGPGPGPGPHPQPTGKHKMPLWMMLKRIPF